MSRSLFTLTSSAALTILLFAPTALAQDDFTEADLAGDYGVAASLPAGAPDSDSIQGAVFFVGRLSFDGMGTVEGTRVMSRIVSLRRILGGLPEQFRVERIEQAISGNYVIRPDGSGSVSLVAVPNLPWRLSDRDSFQTHFENTEVLDIVLVDGGRVFEFVDTWKGERRDSATDEFVGSHEIMLPGTGKQQRPRDTADPRVDTVMLQLCEVIRLLHTPAGRRQAFDAELVEACGTPFEWNGQGTDRP